jgi:hypothetical protein
MIDRHIFEISEDDDEANAFVFPGVNSRAELVPSHGAERRWLGGKIFKFRRVIFSAFYNISRRNVAISLILTCYF